MEDKLPYGKPAPDPVRAEREATIREVLHWHARGNGGPERSIRAYDFDAVVDALMKGLFDNEPEPTRVLIPAEFKAKLKQHIDKLHESLRRLNQGK